MNNFDFFTVILAAILHSGWNFYTKKSEANKIAILWFAWVAAGLVMLPISLVVCDFSDIGFNWIPYLILTGLFHAGYIYTLGLSYGVGEISVIYPISRGIGIFSTTSFMLLFTSEDISADGLLGIIFLVIGIVFVTIKNLRDLEKRNVMTLAARVGIFVSMYSITDKLSIEHIPPFFYMATMFVITPLVMAPFMLTYYKKEVKAVYRSHKIYSSSIGIVSFLTYLMVLTAMLNNPASYIVALRESSIVFGSLLGIFLLKEDRGKRKILGIGMILFGAIIIKIS